VTCRRLFVSVHAPNKAAVNSPVKSSAPTGPARSVLPVRDELAAVETKGQHPGEHLQLFYGKIFLFSTCLLLPVAFVGCGAELDKALVASNFRSKYRCQSERVSKVTGGYVVEGCGFRDEYVCVDSCCDDDGLFEDLIFGSDRCVLARSYRLSKRASGSLKPSVNGEPVPAKNQSYGESNGVEQLTFVIPLSALKAIYRWSQASCRPGVRPSFRDRSVGTRHADAF
jgi:hypothetical protein